MQSRTRTYVVTAATGRIGGSVARKLLEAGHQVIALGRNAEGLRALSDAGAKTLRGDAEDADFVEHAFRGADAAFLLVAGNRMSRDFRRGYADVGRNFARALRKNFVDAALFISCIGAHDEKNRGLVLIHADVEKALNEVPSVRLLHLRASPFFENFFYWLPVIQARNALATPLAPDAKIDLSTTDDVADIATQLLLKLDFQGKSAVEVHGREVLTMRQIAEIIAKQLGRPFPVEQTPRGANIAGLVAHGLSHDFAHLMSDAWDTISTGLLRAPDATANVRGTTPVEDFLRAKFLPALAHESEKNQGLERLVRATGT